MTTADIHDNFVLQDGVKLHYLSSGTSDTHTPLVYVPGFGGDADSFRDEMAYFYPRRCISVGKRGLGQSSVPQTGYGFADIVNDLTSVINHAISKHILSTPLCLMAFSRSVPVAISYAYNHIDTLQGLILLDYRAQYSKFSQAWLKKSLEHGDLPRHYLTTAYEESEDVSLWDVLPAITCPVLIIRGGQSKSLTTDEADQYMATLPDVDVVVFEDSGHEVYKPDYQRFITTIDTFLAAL
ncbi:MAG: alpha/beta hydrolase [Deinococcota bacterium]